MQPKFIAQTSVEQRFCATADNTEFETTQIQDVIDIVPASWLTQESRSAPELTSMNLKEHNQLTESYSDSYTSTCTTTTTTSDEYQRMYNAQSTLLHNQSFYDQSSVDLNSSNCDYEVLSIQQQHASFSSGSTDLMGFSGRKSAQDCSQSIFNTINTSQLVDYIKDNVSFNYCDLSNAMSLPKLPKKVEFAEIITKIDTNALINSGSEPSSIAEEPNQNIQTVPSENIEYIECEKEESKNILKPETPFDRKSITPSPSIIYNSTPKEWKSLMVQALTTASDKPFTITDLPETDVDSCTENYGQTSTTTVEQQTIEIEQTKEAQSVLLEKMENEQANTVELDKCEELPKKGCLASRIITAPTESMDWFKPIYESVPLPEETTPYFPPNIPLLPIEKHEPLRTKSPFVEALTVAPLRPFTPFENDVISQIEGLPRAKLDIKLVDALTTAPIQPITKFNPDLPEETEAERMTRLETEKQEKETAEVRALISKKVDEELSKKCTSFAPFKGYRKVDPFKPQSSSSYNQSPHCQSRSSSVCAENVDKNTDQTQTNTTTTNKACHSQSNRNIKTSIAFPPPPGTPVKSYVQSGLKSPKTIPKYQRQWFNLASQSPIRTPEPSELKENVPLAFIDAPHERTESVSKPIAITISASTSTSTTESRAKTESTFVTDVQNTKSESTSVSSESASSVTTIVPTLSENRNAPITMTFQTIDPKDIIEPIRSTTPSLINKPPPLVPYYQQNLVCEYYSAPNSFTFDPTERTSSPRPDAMKPLACGPPPSILKIQAPRITTPDSIELSNTIGVPSIVTGQSGSAHVLASSKQGYSTSSQSFMTKPEVFHREQKNGLSIETHSSGIELNAAKKSNLQTSSTYQVGNVQVQQSRRVIEEFERTQKSSTTETHTSGTTELEKKIARDAISTNYMTELPYGKGFVARQARRLSDTSQPSKNVVSSYRFPQIISETAEFNFPLENKNVDVPIISTSTSIKSNEKSITKQVAPKTSFTSLPKPSYTQQRLSPIPQNTCYTPQQTSPVPQKISFPPPIDVAAYDEQYNALSSQCTNFTGNALLTTQYQSSAYQPLTTAGPSAFLSNPNYGSTTSKSTTISTSIPGSKPSNFNNNQKTVSVSDPTPASAGSANKNLSSVGTTTSTPKRGRGVLNASVAPGGRTPKCGCCNAQIR